MQRPEPGGEVPVLNRSQVLILEEDHLVLQERSPDLGDPFVVPGGLGEVDAFDHGADGWRQLADLQLAHDGPPPGNVTPKPRRRKHSPPEGLGCRLQPFQPLAAHGRLGVDPEPAAIEQEHAEDIGRLVGAVGLARLPATPA